MRKDTTTCSLPRARQPPAAERVGLFREKNVAEWAEEGRRSELRAAHQMMAMRFDLRVTIQASDASSLTRSAQHTMGG